MSVIEFEGKKAVTLFLFMSAAKKTPENMVPPPPEKSLEDPENTG